VIDEADDRYAFLVSVLDVSAGRAAS